ncbi:DEAD/DEAH box helicase [Candidatus Saccharibacteria bacterium]|nr:DEAD/DEAH box helicase [Candidatus Saccharibacteria bacterium]NCS83110.1 DEAD/DEAH box helicase [Candidatus Saccharibacteria bacterium]
MPYTQHTRSFKSANARPYHSSGRGRQSRPKHGSYIHPSKFINRAVVQTEENAYQATHVFKDFPFSEKLHENIERKGYETLSPIQDQTIPHILAGKDIIGLANTGTGKTAAFLLPILNDLYINRAPGSVLILAPTRELAQQIDEQFREFSNGMKLFSTLVVGGMNIGRQISQLQRRPHVIIGTPGRTMDLIKRKHLSLDAIRVLVLDEADRMLDMGFINDIRSIANQTPKERQTLFFSATITPQIQQLTQEFLKDPETVSVRTADTSEQVEQDIIEAHSKEDKIEKLLDMLTSDEFDKVLLFGETKFGVQRLSDHLEKSGISSVAIHGNKSQSQRQRALKAFKDNRARVLVATDVAARGLDIPNVSHVINFDQPATYEDYVHRIGRTGRAGATGKAFTFVSPSSR